MEFADWNIKTDKVYYSPQWKKMLGYEVDEISDNSVYEWETGFILMT
ncbi:MAG: hypothetical protein R2759_12790 [Bacteroidales bacterium]